MKTLLIKQAIREACIDSAKFAGNLLSWNGIMFSDIREHMPVKGSYGSALKLKKFLIAEKCLKLKGKLLFNTSGFVKILEALA